MPEPSPFERVPDAVSTEGIDQAVERVERIPSGKKASLGRFVVQDSLRLRESRSLRRMPSVSRRDSLAAVGSGAVGVGDIHHLEEEVDVEVIETVHE